MREEFEKVLLSMEPDEMPTPDLRDIAKVFGVRMAIKMVNDFGGSMFYVPQFDCFKTQINKFIKSNYNGHNAREIANACKVSIRYVYKIVGNVDNYSKCMAGAEQQKLSFLT
jgi:Mor family transcriptional regulator